MSVDIDFVFDEKILQINYSEIESGSTFGYYTNYVEGSVINDY